MYSQRERALSVDDVEKGMYGYEPDREPRLEKKTLRFECLKTFCTQSLFYGPLRKPDFCL
jgi:hypothetical protein